MTAIAQHLRELAAAEEPAPGPELLTWPDYAERCYHVGRQSAFREAARLAEAAKPRRGRPAMTAAYVIWRAQLHLAAAGQALSAAAVKWRSRPRRRVCAPGRDAPVAPTRLRHLTAAPPACSKGDRP